ncbi:MAG: matrixin family metalloprotease [Tepidisphaeraceae bacterium]
MLLRRPVLACAWAIVLGLSGSASAIPSLTPHYDTGPAVTWSGGGMHQHRDTDNIDLNAKYDGYSCWDNDQYRNGGAWGHGFQELPARYKFDAAVPQAALQDFNGCVTTWETAINGNGINTNGVPYVTKIDFDQVNINQAHQIDIFWTDIVTGATAFWDPGATDFTFDSNPSYTLTGGPGELIRLAGTLGAGVATITLPREWFFGGTGTPTNQSINLEVTDDGGATWTPFTDTRPRYDFYTIALHELGHAWGLDHIGTAAAGSLMAANISSAVIRTPDANAIDGLKDIYSIAVPEPGTLCAASVLLLVLRRRRTSRWA